MGIKSLWRRLRSRHEPPPPPPVKAAEELVYIPLRQAAERAAGQLYDTVYYSHAEDHGLDHIDPIINWFGNLIASHVPVAIMDGDWHDCLPSYARHEYSKTGAQSFDIINGSTQGLMRGVSGRRFDVAVRSDFFQDFLDDVHLTIRSDPAVYKYGRPHRSKKKIIISADHREPTRDNDFSYEEFDERARRDKGLALVREANSRLERVDAMLRDLKAAKGSPTPKKPRKPKRRAH